MTLKFSTSIPSRRNVVMMTAFHLQDKISQHLQKKKKFVGFVDLWIESTLARQHDDKRHKLQTTDSVWEAS